MKKLPLILFFISILFAGFTSCISEEESTWKEYKEWRESNENWLLEQANRIDENGNNYYTKLVPVWNQDAYVYIHYFNDRKETEGNLSPLFTSTVDVKYIGHLCNGTAFDSSYLNTTPADSIFRTKLSEVIVGWTIALSDMHVGDSCEVLIPYQYAYGSSNTGSIKPYSALQFNIKLVDIPGYEIQP